MTVFSQRERERERERERDKLRRLVFTERVKERLSCSSAVLVLFSKLRTV